MAPHLPYGAQHASRRPNAFLGAHICLKPIILIHGTYLLLSSTLLWVLQPSASHAQETLYQQSLSFFYAMHMALSDYEQHVKETKFSRLISL